jgi:hypothetical protein
VVVSPSSPEGQSDIDHALSADYPRAFIDPATFAFYDSDHLDELRTSRAGIADNITYVLHRLSVNPLRIEAKLGRYFDMLATCDALDHELRDYARGRRSDLPRRERLYETITPEDILQHGTGRSPAIGVATLTVFNHDGVYRAIIVRRSNTLATDAGQYHVAPAFVFQPSGPETFYADEWSVRHQVCREFGEELFAMPEFTNWDSPASARYFYDHPGVNDLRAMLDDGRAELHLMGIAVNLLSTRPEICVLLLIRDAGWYTRSEEMLKAALFTERQETLYVPIDTLGALPNDLHIRMSPQGAAALWMGIDRAREILGM